MPTVLHVGNVVQLRERTLSITRITIRVAREEQGVPVHPAPGGQKIFSRHFSWNEAKIGAEFGQVHPRR